MKKTQHQHRVTNAGLALPWSREEQDTTSCPVSAEKNTYQTPPFYSVALVSKVKRETTSWVRVHKEMDSSKRQIQFLCGFLQDLFSDSLPRRVEHSSGEWVLLKKTTPKRVTMRQSNLVATGVGSKKKWWCLSFRDLWTCSQTTHHFVYHLWENDIESCQTGLQSCTQKIWEWNGSPEWHAIYRQALKSPLTTILLNDKMCTNVEHERLVLAEVCRHMSDTFSPSKEYLCHEVQQQFLQTNTIR